jgi:hypothetical protein
MWLTTQKDKRLSHLLSSSHPYPALLVSD